MPSQKVQEGWFMSCYAGLDRLYFDPGKKSTPQRPKWNDDSVRTSWMLEWFKSLYATSSFAFTGAYLNLNAGDATLLASPSRVETHYWTQNWAAILQQGWGIWPIYQGFANTEQRFVQPPSDWDSNKVQRGVEAGKHIKNIVSTLPSDSAGMVVYIDNEGGPIKDDDKAGPHKDLTGYFRAMFDEMQTDRHDGKPPVRAGLYIREAYVDNLIEMYPDLFIWMIEDFEGNMPPRKSGPPLPDGIRKNGTTFKRHYPHVTPIEMMKNRTSSTSQRFEIERYPITRQDINFLPTGRQCTLGTFDINDRSYDPGGYTYSIISGEVDDKRSTVYPWDFNVSLVRDPRYPDADPRFVCDDAGNVTYGTFDKGGCYIKEAGGYWKALLHFEPESPLILLEQRLYAVDEEGSIVVSAKNYKTPDNAANRNPWSTPVIVVPKGTLRRIRAVSVSRLSAKEVLLLYVSKDHQIHAYLGTTENVSDIRRLIKWKDSGAWAIGNLHPFTNISAVRFKEKIYLLVMQLLSNTTVEASLSVATWPVPGSTTLGNALKGSAIASVATDEYLFVFVVNKDNKLSYAYALMDPKQNSLRWSSLDVPKAPQGKQAPPFLHPHTRISACAVSSTAVSVAAIRFDGIPAVFEFKLAGNIWAFMGWTQFPFGETAASQGSIEGFEMAEGWTTNVHGDIVLRQNGDTAELYCAGTAPGQSSTMLRRTAKKEGWFRLKD